MLILSENHLRSILQMKDVIFAVEAGFRALADRKALAPERLHMPVPEQGAVTLLMPAHIESTETGNGIGAKIVSVFEKNSERGLDIVQGIYILLDGDTGVPLSVMDGKFITAIRTAATSAVATRFMSGRGRKKLAVLGAGVQAAFHIEAMLEVADIEYIALASRSQERAGRLAELTNVGFGVECKVRSIEDAITECDLICACTNSATPLFDGSLIKPGTHINAVGAFTPQTRELDTTTLLRSRVIIDERNAAGHEAGDILIPVSEGAIRVDHIKGTLAEVVTGLVAGRTSGEEITLFKSCGLAIEDLVTAQLAFKRALESKVGVEIDM